jgi:hypothetical protein
MSRMIYYVPPGWEPSHPNPYTHDGSYGRSWSGFQLLTQDTDRFMTARQPNGLFLVQAARRVTHLFNALGSPLAIDEPYAPMIPQWPSTPRHARRGIRLRETGCLSPRPV